MTGTGRRGDRTARTAPAMAAMAAIAALLTATTAVAEALEPSGLARSLEATIRFLAADALEGRAPGSRGDELTRLYLETELRRLGYRPGAPDGSYQQRFEIVGIDATPPPVWTFRAPGGAAELALSREFIAASGVQSPVARIEDAELVFVGYGITAPEYDWDDFKGADLSGKVLLILNNDPDWDPDLFAGERRLYYGRWTYKYESAARQGAAGAIIIHTTPSAGYPWQVVQSSWTGEQFELPDDGEPRLQVAALDHRGGHPPAARRGRRRPRRARRASALEGIPAGPAGHRTAISLPNRLRRVETANVLGLLPGAIRPWRDEVVIYTAHHDHLGVGEPDDAWRPDLQRRPRQRRPAAPSCSRSPRPWRTARRRPRRSVLFAFVAAEEQGLLGSAHYAAHPTFEPGGSRRTSTWTAATSAAGPATSPTSATASRASTR